MQTLIRASISKQEVDMTEQEPKLRIESLTKDYNEALESGCSPLLANFAYAVGIAAFIKDTAEIYFKHPSDRVTPVIGIFHSIL